MSEFVKKETLPTCDICTHVERKQQPFPAVADVRTASGRWANVCTDHLAEVDEQTCHSRSHLLGTGYGQMFLLPEDTYTASIKADGRCPYCSVVIVFTEHDDYCPRVWEA